jgi:membrane associated rhomboid family serine protease
MQPAAPERRSPREEGLALIGLLVAAMWVSEVIDTVDHHKLDQYGIQPHETDGLIGIVTAPFLHAGFGHLIGNTVPFVVLGVLIALSGAARVVAVTAIVALISGLGVWVIAPEHTNHIGASGVVFGFASYLVARGFYNRSLIEIAVGIVVVAVFGVSLLSGLAPQQGISWQGHLFGAIGGVVAAWLLARDRRPPDRIGTAKPGALA